MSYLASLLAGIGVGIVYALIGVRSPAPPTIALVGLLGIVLGETGANLARQQLVRSAPAGSSANAPPR